MSIAMQRIGGRPLSRDGDDETEREYDRLRDLARAEAQKRHECIERSQTAYKSGDGAGAKDYSNQGKKHDAKADEYNRQASDFIFRENNAHGRVEEDEIDLHGQFVEEAERILEERIRADQQAGQTHLRAIVGKGNHSAGGVQKLKPKVEELCRELGLKYRTEENAGRIYINLQGGEPLQPGEGGGHHQKPHHGRPDYHEPPSQGHGRPPHHGGQQQPHRPHQQPHEPEEERDQDLLGRILRKLEKQCCVVM